MIREEYMKIVIIVNKELPVGLTANSCAVLGINLGQRYPQIIGEDIPDADGTVHKGITSMTIPVLASDGEGLKELFEQTLENDSVELVGFNRVAQSCRNYNDYTEKLSTTSRKDLEFSALSMAGSRKQIEKLTGSLALYR